MTTSPSDRTFSSDFKRFFVRGLVILLPSILTLWIIVKAYQFVDNAIAEPINGWVRSGLVQVSGRWAPLRATFEPSDAEVDAAWVVRYGGPVPGPEAVSPRRDRLRTELRAESIGKWWADRWWYLDLIGLFVAVISAYVAGRLLGGFFGRRIYKSLERIITRLPIFKQVYPSVKQVVDFLFGDERQLRFNRVVLVQYPRKGTWSMGFQMGNAMKAISQEAGDAVTVFMPSSPTPFTGYAITVRRREIVELPITVDEAIRYLVSGGVLVPKRQVAADAAPPAGSEAAAGPGGEVAAAAAVPRRVPWRRAKPPPAREPAAETEI